MVLLVLYLGKCGVSKHSKVAWWWIFGEFWGVPSLKFNMEPWKWWFPIWISFSKGPLFRFHVCFGGCKDEGSPIPLLRGTSPVLVSIEENTHRSRVLDWKNKENLATFRPQKHVGLNKWRTSTFRLTFWSPYESIRTLKDNHRYRYLPFLKRSTTVSIFFFFKFLGKSVTFPHFFPTPKHQQENPIWRVSGSWTESPGSQVNLSIVQVNLFWSAFESWNPQYDCWWTKSCTSWGW